VYLKCPVFLNLLQFKQMICNLNSITELERLLEHERRKLQAEDIPMVKKILSELVEKKR
jgi:hypothetical protein